MEGKTLAERTQTIRAMWRKGKTELQKMESLVSRDDYDIERLDRDELLKLLQEKEIESGQQLSEEALHVLVAGRCAGSYGCGIT